MKYLAKSIQLTITVLISILGLYLFFSGDYKLQDFFRIIKTLDLEYIFFAATLLVVSVFVRAYRWKLLFSKEDSVDNYFLFKSEFIGYFANNILPLRLGEIVRAVIVSDRYKLSKTYVFGTIVIERILDIFAALVFGFVILVLLLLFPSNAFFGFNSNDASIVSRLIIVLVCMLAPIIISALVFLFIDKKSEHWIIRFIVKMFSSLKNIDSSKVIPIILSSMMIWLIYWVDVYLIGKAFTTINGSKLFYLFDSMLILVGSTIGIAIPSLPGSWGAFHLSIDFVISSNYDINEILRKNFTMLLHLYGFITYSLCGFLYLLTVDFAKIITNLKGTSSNE